jgi:hypothetical protein
MILQVVKIRRIEAFNRIALCYITPKCSGQSFLTVTGIIIADMRQPGQKQQKKTNG